MPVPQQMLTMIRAIGGVSIPSFVSVEERNELLSELSGMELEQQPDIHGPYKVRQSFSSATRFVAGGAFVRTYLKVESSVNEWFGAMEPSPLRAPFRFTDLVVQKYLPGPTGISPHRDGESYINIIAVLVLEGQGRFAFCGDREKNRIREIPNNPGDLILMRGVGFDGSDFQPFHFVDNITSTRTTFAMRQYLPKGT